MSVTTLRIVIVSSKTVLERPVTPMGEMEDFTGSERSFSEPQGTHHVTLDPVGRDATRPRRPIGKFN